MPPPPRSPLDESSGHHVPQTPRGAGDDAYFALHGEAREGALGVTTVTGALDVVARVVVLPRLWGMSATTSQSESEDVESLVEIHRSTPTHRRVLEPDGLIHDGELGLHLDPMLLELGVVLPVLVVLADGLGRGRVLADVEVAHGEGLDGAVRREETRGERGGGGTKRAESGGAQESRHFGSLLVVLGLDFSLRVGVRVWVWVGGIST